jgi:hypothetical protein
MEVALGFNPTDEANLEGFDDFRISPMLLFIRKVTSRVKGAEKLFLAFDI